MFNNEEGLRRFTGDHGRQKAIELVGDINEYTRRYRPREPDGEPANAPSLVETRCLLDFNEHFIEMSNGGEYLRSLSFALTILMFVIFPAIPVVMVIAMYVSGGFDFLTFFSSILLVGALTLCYFMWPIVVSPAFFTVLRARYRFNRTTGKVYVVRPKRYGGNAVLDWDRVQAHVRWRGARRMTHDDLRNPTLRMIRQSDIECVALVLYWPPFDANDPERKGEDILWVCPDVVTGEFYWQYIRTFMEEGMDAVPSPGDKDWLRKGFSSPGELMREQASSSTLVNVLDFIWWPVQSLAERLCYWPTFPEEWNSDCGQKRRERGIGPEEPLRWEARDPHDTEKDVPRSSWQSIDDGDTRIGEAVEKRVSPGVLLAHRPEDASQETHARSASGPFNPSAALPALPIVGSQDAAEPIRNTVDTASLVELTTTFIDIFQD